MDEIQIFPYDPAWPTKFQAEAQQLWPLLEPFELVAIEHIGSTAIPGLDAKPIIDIMAGFVSFEDRDAIVAAIEGCGYSHWYEDPWRETRMFFVKGLPPLADRRTHHVHSVLRGSDFWQKQIAFRDSLRTHPDEAAAYLALKHNLARQFPTDRDAYTDGKTSFVENILVKAHVG